MENYRAGICQLPIELFSEGNSFRLIHSLDSVGRTISAIDQLAIWPPYPSFIAKHEENTKATHYQPMHWLPQIIYQDSIDEDCFKQDLRYLYVSYKATDRYDKGTDG